MIRCLLALVTRTRHGEPVRSERAIVGESVRIGRGTDCAIHLSDPRVKYHHATIRVAFDGKLRLESTDKSIKGQHESERDRVLQPGADFMLGPYRLSVEEIRAGHDLVLAVELVQALADERRELRARSRTLLTQTALSMRGLAMGLAVVILAGFLALPALYAAKPEVRRATEWMPVAPDQSWNVGPLSDAHHSLSSNCSECHQKPFVHVQDAACEQCHTYIGDHIADKELHAKVFGETRCAQCHLEHQGNQGLSHATSGLCVDCHRSIKSTVAGSTLPDISDFLDDHPPFKPTVRIGPGEGGWKRISQSQPALLVERSGLKFPHALHVAEDGVNGPDGKALLKCKSCHTPDEAGVRFKPIAMVTHCASCHGLQFEPALTRREVPHGSVATTMIVLREFYAGISIGEMPIDIVTVDGLLRRPGVGPGEVARRQAQVWAESKAMVVARDLFEVRSCHTCHEVERNADNRAEPWTITPVVLNDRWLPKARFGHSQHRDVGCIGCHAMAGSKNSADVGIPEISVCRHCHVGSRPQRNKIVSGCGSCHGFHLDSEILTLGLAHPAMPAAIGNQQTAPAAPAQEHR